MTINDIPYYRMNSAVTKLWLISPEARNRLATRLTQKHRSGVGMCSATLHLIAYIQPNGVIRELPPPHRTMNMWQMVNKPERQVCACYDYYDPESHGPWGDRPNEQAHHPMCQFERVAEKVYERAHHSASGVLDHTGGLTGDAINRRRDNKISLQSRPDEWERLRKAELPS